MKEDKIDAGTWEITFTDMLTLLLTFLVFIISVSSFKAVEYKKLWKAGTEEAPARKAAAASFRFPLIKGLKLPRLSGEARQLLNEIEAVFVNSDFTGMDVAYDENKITLMVSEQISFEGNSTDLKKEAEALLLQLVEPINQSKFDFSIEGHTDINPDTDTNTNTDTKANTNPLPLPRVDNMELSLDRALVVARFLLAHGVEEQKISVAGYGPYRPIASNETPEGRQLNRRVEINVIIRND
jgi:chemotaxis protein MotB